MKMPDICLRHVAHVKDLCGKGLCGTFKSSAAPAMDEAHMHESCRTYVRTCDRVVCGTSRVEPCCICTINNGVCDTCGV